MGNAPKRPKTTTPVASAAGPSPWPKRLAYAAGALVVVGLLAVIVLSSDPVRGVPEGTQEVTVAGAQHIEGAIQYDTPQPAGGPHNSVWQNCGYYSAPIRTENAIHSLEHGVVWITYNEALPEDQVQDLIGIAQRNNKVLVSPEPGQPSPILLRAWGWKLELETTDDPRLDQFVNEFEGSLAAPEPGGVCFGGVGTPDA